MNREACKVVVPFWRSDIDPIRFTFELMFIDGEPFAVTNWSATPIGLMPTFVLPLDKKYLKEDRFGSRTYSYSSVMTDPRMAA